MPKKPNVVCREVFIDNNIKDLAGEMGLSAAFLYKWCQADGGRASGGFNALMRISALTRITKDLRPVKWLCSDAGGYYVHNPEVKAGKVVPLSLAEMKVVHDFAQMIAFLTKLAGRKKLSREDVEFVREHWDELKSLMEGFVCSCEKGTFGLDAMEAAINAHVEKKRTRFSSAKAPARPTRAARV